MLSKSYIVLHCSSIVLATHFPEKILLENMTLQYVHSHKISPQTTLLENIKILVILHQEKRGALNFT